MRLATITLNGRWREGLFGRHPLTSAGRISIRRDVDGRAGTLADIFSGAAMLIEFGDWEPVKIPTRYSRLSPDLATAELPGVVTLLPGDPLCPGIASARLTLPPPGRTPPWSWARATAVEVGEVRAAPDDKRLQI